MKFVKIKSIKQKGMEEVFDLSLEKDHSFFANNICIHNCGDPNLQQMPKQGYEGERFRPIFGCPEDYYLCETDQSGFQLRIAAIMSKDPVMTDLFLNKSGDMHSVTAQGVFCRKIELEQFLKGIKEGNKEFKKYRHKSKFVNFGFLFLRSSFSFKSDLEENWTDQEIKEYIEQNNIEVIKDSRGIEDLYLTVATDIRNKFFETYPNLEPWGRSQIDFAKKHGYIDCMLGGRRHTPLLTYINKDDKNSGKWVSHYEKIVVNSPVQTFEALTIYKAMMEIDKKIVDNNYKSIIIGMVHDSIVMYIHKNELEQMWYIIKEAMDDNETYSIPLKGETDYGKVWGFSLIMETIEDVKKFKEREGII